MRYFADVHTLADLKAQYRRLAMQHHPDRGGDTATMQAINAEHDELFVQLARMQNACAADDTTGRVKPTTEAPEEFRQVIDLLMKLDGLDVELCGSWLWIGGNTKPHKERLKTVGCRWSSSKKLWYWHHPEEGAGWSRGKASMQTIRGKYGSQRFRGRQEVREEIAAH